MGRALWKLLLVASDGASPDCPGAAMGPAAPPAPVSRGPGA